MRSFVGLSLPEEAILALETLQEEIPVGRVVPGDNLHLTLAFLDDQPDFALQLLHEELTRIAAVPLRLRITGLDLFGGRVPRILFAAVVPDPGLSRLRDQVRRAAERAEIDLPRERFRPHITLARFARQMPEHKAQRLGAFLQAQGDFSLPEVQIDHMALFRSTLTPEGARYEVLAGYPLEDPGTS